MTEALQTQVVIVGGGPVGMGLAVDLALRDIDCVVVERYRQPLPIPKGQNLTGRTVEHFYFWGIDEALRAAREMPADYGAAGITAYGTLLSGYHYEWLSRHWVRPFYFRGNERVPQYGTERVLRERAAGLPRITTLYGWRGVEVSQDAHGAAALIRETGGNGEKTVRGNYLVGCDGAWSTVREQAALPLTQNQHDRRMVLLVFRSPQLHRLLEAEYPGVSFFSVLNPEHAGYWLFFGRVDPQTWFFHAPVPADTSRDNFDFAAYLHRAVGAGFAVEFQHIGFWDLRIALADEYRNGRLFIAGDAAHSHPPYGGYGINTGFEDIRNLGWKLAAVLRGWADEGLLDSYGEERQPVFRSTADDFIEKSIRADGEFVARYSPDKDRAAFERAWAARSAGAPDEVDAYEPNYEGSSIVFGPAGATCSARGAHRYEARAGHRLVPQPLTDGANVYESLGNGFTLLAIGADADSIADFERAARAGDVPLDVIRAEETDDLGKYGARLVLVRPDQFIAWIGDASAGAAAAILARAIAAK